MAPHDRGEGVVLIVEDEPLTLMQTDEAITDAGFETICVASADDGASLIESRDDIIAILTDVNMPGSIDGLQMAHAARKRRPSVGIVVTSAMSLGGDQPLPTRGVFLQKPCRPSEIIRALRKLVA